MHCQSVFPERIRTKPRDSQAKVIVVKCSTRIMWLVKRCATGILQNDPIITARVGKISLLKANKFWRGLSAYIFRHWGNPELKISIKAYIVEVLEDRFKWCHSFKRIYFNLAEHINKNMTLTSFKEQTDTLPVIIYLQKREGKSYLKYGNRKAKHKCSSSTSKRASYLNTCSVNGDGRYNWSFLWQ